MTILKGFVIFSKAQIQQYRVYLKADIHRFKTENDVYRVPFHEFKDKSEIQFFLNHAQEPIKELYNQIEEYNAKINALIEANMTINQAIADGNLVNYERLHYPDTPVTPMSHQRLAFNASVKFDRYGLFCEMGLGKALANSVKVLTPYGFREIGKIRIGDYVTGRNGNPTQVTGVYPQGKIDLYKIKFNDGAETICCDEHLWEVNTPVRKDRGYKPMIKSTKEICARIKDINGNRLHHIPLVKPVYFPERALPIDPYILGCLIGDGSMVRNYVMMTTPEKEIVDKFDKMYGLTFYERDNNLYQFSICNAKPLIYKLNDLELYGCRSWEKFIPDVYKFSSINDRIAMLRGLLDTDGSISNGMIEFSSASEQLANDVKFLVQSLGGIARLGVKKITKYSYKGEIKYGRTSYRLNIKMPEGINPFLLKRKADLWKPCKKYKPARLIDSIEYYGNDYATCISVDAPDNLYVIEDCIVTHNTKLALDILQHYINSGEVKTAIIVCPLSVISSWQKEFEKNKCSEARLFVLRNKHTIASYMECKTPAIGVVNWDSLFKWVNQKPDMVIFDESTKAKNHKAKRTKSAIEIADHCKKALALTGSVITNNMEDIWSQYRIIDGGRMFRTSFYSFKHHYFMPVDANKYVWIPKGGTVEDISARLFAQAIIIKKEHCLNLPEKIYEVREIELDVQERKLYDKMKDDFIISFNDKTIEAQNVLSQMAKLRQLTSGFIYDGQKEVHRMVNKSKFNELKEVLDEIGNKKVVIWACFREEIKFLLDNIKGSVGLYGDTSHNSKQIINDFVEGDIQYLICNPATAGHGIDGLQKVCDTVIYYSNPMSVDQRKQSEDRNHRMGMKGSVTYIELICKGTIDESILKSLKEKIDIGKRITDINSIRNIVEGK